MRKDYDAVTLPSNRLKLPIFIIKKKTSAAQIDLLKYEQAGSTVTLHVQVQVI